MDFLDPKKKRAHIIRLYVGYVLIGLIIAFTTTILLFQSNGFDVDPKTGQIIQKGLVFVTAHPETADIYLNDKPYKTNSNARMLLPAGDYKITLKRQGYRDWQRSFTLMGRSIERFVYPVMFPSKLDTVDRQKYTTTPPFATNSPDRRWILVQQPAQFNQFDVIDANDPAKPVTTLTVPTTELTNATQQTWELVDWSNDSRHLLLQHRYDGNSEFIMIDRANSEKTVNLNRIFKRNPTQVHMRDKKFDHLYLYDVGSQQLELGNLPDGKLEPVLSDVLSYKPHGQDMILYATKTGAAEGKARVVIRDGKTDYSLREVSLGDTPSSYLLDLAQYDSDWYMLAGSSVDQKVYVYRNPLETLKQTPKPMLIPATVLRVDQPTHVSFSANTRFMAVQGGSKFAVYDAEYDRSFRYTLPVELDTEQPAKWMDGHRLTARSQSKLVIFDYDGINLQSLTPMLANSLPFFDRDYKRLYTLAPSVQNPAEFALSKTNLKVVAPGQEP